MASAAGESIPDCSRLHTALLLTLTFAMPPSSQALITAYGNQTDIAEVGYITGRFSEQEGFRHPVDMCDYKYLLLIDGNTLSGRLPSLAICKSMIITHDTPWEDMVTSMLSAYNGQGGLLTVGSSWEKLGEMIQSFEVDSAKIAQEVDARAQLMQFLLSPVGVSCYIRELLLQTAKQMQFQVDLRENLWGGARPVPLEEYLLTHMAIG